MDRSRLLARARTKGVDPVVYRVARALLVPVCRVYWRKRVVGGEHVPARGPVILAANHRSFLDPFVIGTCVKRPVYYVAKKEIFAHPLLGWLLNALGAFPIDRGNADDDAMGTARQILERGDCVLIFPEGTRVRPGPLGEPRRGVGRLALETGAPVVPVSIHGTEAVRRGWRFRPHRVSVRMGRPLQVPRVEHPSPRLAAAVTDRIWPSVQLGWEWLGGTPPLRRAAVLGTGPWASALAGALDRAGVEVLDRAGDDVEVVLRAPADGTPPTAERTGSGAVARLGGPAPEAGVLPHGAPLLVAAPDASFGAQLARALRAAGLDVRRTTDPAAVAQPPTAPRAAETPRPRVAA